MGRHAPVAQTSASGCFRRRLDPGDVDLPHRHHRRERASGLFAVGRGGELHQSPRSDLPADAPAILAPAAIALLAAVADNGVPIAVGLFLALGQHHEADGLVRRKGRATVETQEGSPEHGELHGQFIAFLAAGIVRRRRVHSVDMAVGKCGGVELGGLAGFAVVEPQAGDEVGHGASPGSPNVRRACGSGSGRRIWPMLRVRYDSLRFPLLMMKLGDAGVERAGAGSRPSRGERERVRRGWRVAPRTR